MTYAQMLVEAKEFLRRADLFGTKTRDRANLIRLAEAWIALAAEVRQSGTLTDEQANRELSE